MPATVAGMSLVLVDVADGVATLTLNNPAERNTLTAPMVEEIIAAMDRIEGDESIGAIRWLYEFGTGQSSSLPNPAYTFPDTGVYEVMQIVTHPSGCLDTLIRAIDVRPEVRYYLPNAFTPNNDGSNDEYVGTGIMEGASNFKLSIWNRWGEQVFETSDPFSGWNGRKHNTGKEVPSGVYMVLATFNGPRGEPYELKGVATVIR